MTLELGLNLPLCFESVPVIPCRGFYKGVVDGIDTLNLPPECAYPSCRLLNRRESVLRIAPNIGGYDNMPFNPGAQKVLCRQRGASWFQVRSTCRRAKTRSPSAKRYTALSMADEPSRSL